MDSLEEKVKTFFTKCKSTPSLKQEWKDEQFNKIKEVSTTFQTEMIYDGH